MNQTREELERIVWQAVTEVAEEQGCWPSHVLYRGHQVPATQSGVDEIVSRLLHPSTRTTVGEELARLGGAIIVGGETIPIDPDPDESEGHPIIGVEGLRPRRNVLSRFWRAIKHGRRVTL